jgi:hypothetical protein
MPPLPLWNRYACLFVDEIHPAPSLNKPDSILAVQKLQIPQAAQCVRRWERHLPRRYIVAATPTENSLSVDVKVETTDTGVKRALSALVDCGATGLFMDCDWAHANNITTRTLTRPIPVFNVDSTPNEAGAIQEIADLVLRYDGHAEHAQFAITQLGKQDLILGFTWL